MFFFFFKQKTAYEMRISDWSSDVCSSDLITVIHLAVRRSESGALRQIPRGFGRRRQLQANAVPAANEWISGAEGFRQSTGRLRPSLEITNRGARCAQNGRASWRESGWEEVWYLGGAGLRKKKKTK